MLILTLLSLACSALAISNLVTASVMERGAELALLEAIGAPAASVSLLVLAETSVLTAAGGICGYFLGLGFARVIGRAVFGSPIAANMTVPPLVALMVLLVTAAGCAPALRAIMSLRPAEALHG
jgi:putative ABC transport system permease protein